MIPELTKDCPREDCCVAHTGSSTTLMGWSPTYDKRGNQQGRDPNIITSSYVCHTCGLSWRVKSQDGREDVIQRFEPKPVVTSAV